MESISNLEWAGEQVVLAHVRACKHLRMQNAGFSSSPKAFPPYVYRYREPNSFKPFEPTTKPFEPPINNTLTRNLVSIKTNMMETNVMETNVVETKKSLEPAETNVVLPKVIEAIVVEQGSVMEPSSSLEVKDIENEIDLDQDKPSSTDQSVTTAEALISPSRKLDLAPNDSVEPRPFHSEPPPPPPVASNSVASTGDRQPRQRGRYPEGKSRIPSHIASGPKMRKPILGQDHSGARPASKAHAKRTPPSPNPPSADADRSPTIEPWPASDETTIAQEQLAAIMLLQQQYDKDEETDSIAEALANMRLDDTSPI